MPENTGFLSKISYQQIPCTYEQKTHCKSCRGIHIMALTEDSGQDNDSEERRFGKDSNGEIDLLQVVLSSQFA